jgi:NADPH:quinone reductase-like Zn-dependent oxidoreductase
MKAIRMHPALTGIDGLFFEQAPQPQPAPGEALVKVQAAGITPTEFAWSTNWTTKNGSGRQNPIPGHEFSGIVNAVGAGLGADLVGQAVYALTDFHSDGAQAEYTLAQPAELAPLPSNLSPQQAAAVPLSALTAWQALFEKGQLDIGHKLLVHGGAGGVGSMAVQLAHWAGAYVIATASMGDLNFVRSLGADETIPYHLARFEKIVHHTDIVLDTIGGDTLERSWGVLKRGGILVSVAEVPSPERASTHHVRAAYFIVRPERSQLVRIGGLIASGRVKPILDSVYPLEQASQAYLHARDGHPRGKVVLQIEGA